MKKLDKENFRISAKNALKKASLIRAKSANYKMINEILKIIKFQNFRKILIFMPLKIEPNVLILRKKCKNCTFLVPFMLNVSFKMVKLRYPFEISHFGVKESKNQNAFLQKIDLAVVPVVGVDGNLARIGHGKGFYDRFFSGLNYKPFIVFVSLADNFTPEIISQKHDIIGDCYITPKKIYVKRGTNDRNFSYFSSWHFRGWNWLFNRKKNQ